jgi:hypothetical protein
MPGPEPTPQGPPTSGQVAMVQYCWRLLANRREEFVAAILARATELDQSLTLLLAAHPIEVEAAVGSMSALIAIMDDGAMFDELISPVVRSELALSIPDNKHAVFGAALIWTLGHFLREEFDDSFQKAWMMAFQWTQSRFAKPVVISIMSERDDADIYSRPPTKYASTA